MNIDQILIEVKGYQDLSEPVILTSGELGIYYINSENLVQDQGKWADYPNDSLAMIKHSIETMEAKPSYHTVIKALAKAVEEVLPKNYARDKILISGGQRRDWIFSGPVAKELGLAHLSIHKDSSAFLISADLQDIKPLSDQEEPLKGYYAIHVVDLLTLGSSAYNPNVEPKNGWIIYIRNLGAEIKHLISVVNRNQGAEAILAQVGVQVRSLISIDSEFLSKNSKSPEQALAYTKNPQVWSESFIANQGIDIFINYFDPAAGKLDRAKKFINKYADILNKTGKMLELKNKVKEKYHINI